MGLVYAFSTPIFEASDEIWHYPVVREIAENRRLPVQDPNVQTAWAQEGSQPPLYYLIAAIITGWIDGGDYDANAIANPFPKIGVPGANDNVNLDAHPPGQSVLQGGTALSVHSIRWLSLLMGAVTVYLTYRLACSVFPSRTHLPLLAAALVAFNPMVLFINASINNDNLVMLLTTLGLWLAVIDMRSQEPGMRWPMTIGLGIVAGLAALAKVSGALLLPAIAIALILPLRRPGVESRPGDIADTALRAAPYAVIWKRLAVFFLLAALIAGWWYVRNLLLYGELLGLRMMTQFTEPRPSGFVVFDLLAEWQSFWYSFWGLFGAFNMLAPAWYYWLTGGLALMSGLGLLAAVGRMAVRKRVPASWPIHLVLLVYLALTLFGLIRLTLVTPASQGRLLFGAIAPIAIYLAFGLLAWLPQQRQRWPVRFVCLALAAVAALLPFLVIVPTYRPPAAIAALPAGATPLDVRFGSDIELAGYRLEASSTAPGQTLPITLFWRTNRPIDRFYQLSLNGFGFEMENVAKLDTWPGGGLLPTAFWQPGLLYPDTYRLAVDRSAATPSLLKLGVSFNTDLLNLPESESLPVSSAGQPAGNIFLDAGTVAAALVPAANAEPPIARLQHGIRLDQHHLVRHSDRLELELLWSASEAIPDDYQIFVHLVDAAGQQVAYGDAPPRRGFWPTHLWRPGETVASEHVIPLPPDLPPGEYQLKVGMYDLEGSLRLAAFDATGEPWPDQAIVLPAIAE